MRHINIKIIGLAVLLIAWGADHFWRSASEQQLRKIEFITISHQLTNTDADIQFLKYLSQNRSDAALLALSYRARIEAILSTCSLLGETDIKPNKEIQQKAQQLKEFVNVAYEQKISLEPKDIKRNILHEIIEMEKEAQKYTIQAIIAARNGLRVWSIVFVIMYIIGSICLIVGESQKAKR